MERPDPMRHLVLWCPHWAVVASGVAPGTPAVVLRDHRVLAASRAARAEGVRLGMRRREAQARCPEVVIVDDDPARDARRFEVVARAVADAVGLLETARPGALWFATRGPARRCGGEVALADLIATIATQALGESADLVDGLGVGVADGRFAASVAARRSIRSGAPVLVPAGAESTAAALAPVPVRALEDVAGVSVGLVGVLERLGIDTLGALAALPGPEVMARFGPPGAWARQLAAGEDDRPPQVVDPPADLAVERVFEDPVDQVGSLVFVARQLAEELDAGLQVRGQCCTRLLVEVETEHGERSERQWYHPAGLGVAAMVERVRWQLDGWVGQRQGPGSGAVLLRLAPRQLRALEGRQLGFWGELGAADTAAARAIARVTGLLGPEAVTVAEWRGGRHPAERYRLVPAAGADLSDLAARRRATEPGAGPWPGEVGAPWPAWVATEPVGIDVLDAHGGQVRVDSRGTPSAAPAQLVDRRGTHRIERGAGPWPTEERWWDPARRRRRARFQVLTDAGEALLVGLEGGSWWLEARYA